MRSPSNSVARARLSQILSLTLLAPDIQEVLLFLPAGATLRAALTERQLRPLVRESDWNRQRRLWDQLRASVPRSPGREPSAPSDSPSPRIAKYGRLEGW